MRSCEECDERFPLSFFADRSTCRLCVNERQYRDLKNQYDNLKEQHKNLKEQHDNLKEQHDNLKEQHESLKEFVAANIVEPPNSSPASSSSTPEGDFIPVRNGVRPSPPKTMLGITTFNRYQILSDTIEEEHETRLIGDSMIRGQLTEFCGRASHGKRKRMCFPGAKINDIIAARDDVTTGSDENSLLVIHVGTNDVKASRSEELMEKYKRMIQHYKEKSNNIVVSGILPRLNESDAFYNKAFSTNNRLKSLCAQEGVDFANFWDNFYYAHHLFELDGVHLNPVGAARFGRLLCNQVSQFRRKNSTRQPTENVT